MMNARECHESACRQAGAGRGRALAAILALAVLAGASAAQPAGPASSPAADPNSMVALNFPDSVDLKVLIDYVGKREGINMIYSDEQIGGKKVTIKAPEKIPAKSLMALLESALAMKGLSITPTGVHGVMQVEAGRPLTAVAMVPDGDANAPRWSSMAVTRVFAPRNASVAQAEQMIKPFMSSPNASLIPLPAQGLLIVTDYADGMKRIEYLMGLIDNPSQKVVMRYVSLKHAEASTASAKLVQLLAGRDKARGAGGSQGGFSVVSNERTNQLVLVGTADEVADAERILESLDVPSDAITKTYLLKHASPRQVDRLAKDLLGNADAVRLYKSAVDADAGLLAATTTPEVHKQIESLVATLDKPRPESQSPIRFYKLKNAKAAEVLSTLEGIEGDRGIEGASAEASKANLAEPVPYPPPPAGVRGPRGSSVQAGEAGVDGVDEKPSGQRGASKSYADLQNVRVLADEASNSIIVVAEPQMQAVYEKLIGQLDVRRPQVHVEATVITVDTTDDFMLGVEISRSDSADGGKTKTLNFSSFGLSTPNASTGTLTLKPGIGFNGVMLSADIADIVIRALESDSRAKVVSRPSILINDNATGTLASESEEPYASVNASSTVATTSYGGNSKAGTKITVSPQISEGDYLKLKYQIELSSFGGSRTDVLPPSKHTDSIDSDATIPDGYTIVVGGLSRESLSELTDRVPGLGRLPGLEYLFSSRTKGARRTTLFVFLRAVILRDDKFEDLKDLSRGAIGLAGLPGDCPRSEAVEMR